MCLSATIAVLFALQLPLAAQEKPPPSQAELATALEAVARFLQVAPEAVTIAESRVLHAGLAARFRTIGLKVDAEPHGRVHIDFCLEPEPYVRSASWQDAPRDPPAATATLDEAYEIAWQFVSSRMLGWDDGESTLVAGHAGHSRGQVTLFYFGWDIGVRNGLARGGHVTLRDDPLAVDSYSVTVLPAASVPTDPLPLLTCLPVAQAAQEVVYPGHPHLFRAEMGRRAIEGQAHVPWVLTGFVRVTRHSLGWRCAVDPVTGELTVPEAYVNEPTVLAAADRVRRGITPPRPEAPEPPQVAARDDARALQAVATFLNVVEADLTLESIEWGAGQLAADAAEMVVTARDQEEPRRVTLTVQAHEPYWVSHATAPAETGVWMLALLEEERDIKRESHTRVAGRSPWAGEGLVAVKRPWPLWVDWTPRSGWWSHDTRGMLRTGTWLRTDSQYVYDDEGNGRGVSVTEYAARVAPFHGIDEMTVDLLDAIATVQEQVEQQPGAIFRSSYSVPTFSHPSAKDENPAWEIRYYVGPGGPEPDVRWAAVDATDGSIIFIDREKPECCYPRP